MTLAQRWQIQTSWYDVTAEKRNFRTPPDGDLHRDVSTTSVGLAGTVERGTIDEIASVNRC
jgi:hypothetical protein